ncbi:MAG: stress response translation initiation inhibitor YciH [Chloroflexi bacterium]|nr:stress response translation initiation inhibitor YciH [Chloroflexota bacterium]MDA1145108.1 stress response translation initiation inhibitor YciH [Chloroflexota bacterium]
MSNSNLVWSSDGGRAKPRAEPPRPSRPPKRGPSSRGDTDSLPTDPGDGFVRLHRGKSAKGGKPGTLVVGLPGTDADLDAVLKRCKQRIGAGGTRQQRVLVIQGDHRDKLKTLLEADGHKVKLAGG